MLMTLKHEAKRQSFPMPSPTRTHKVKMTSFCIVDQIMNNKYTSKRK